jgi:hypothetical protein
MRRCKSLSCVFSAVRHAVAGPERLRDLDVDLKLHVAVVTVSAPRAQGQAPARGHAGGTAGTPFDEQTLAKQRDRDIAVTALNDGLPAGGTTWQISPKKPPEIPDRPRAKTVGSAATFTARSLDVN